MTDFDLYDACAAIIIVAGANGDIVFANQTAKQQPDLQTILGDSSNIADAMLLDPAQIQTAGRLQSRLGDESWGIQIEPVQTANDEYRVLTLTRLTGQKRLRAELNRLNTEIGAGNSAYRLETGLDKGVAPQIANMVNTSLESLDAHIAEFTDIMNLLATCDLRIPGNAGQLEGNFGALQDRLSTTIANMTESIRQTIGSSESITQTTANIVGQHHKLADRTTRQAEAIQQTSANMEQMSASVANAARNAEKASQQGKNATHLAESGMEAVRQVVTSMDEITGGAREISEILEVINNLSFQTNILALNASVEAARAGKHGRGFNIVAEEVRSLADRSAEAADQIKKLVENSVAVSEDGKSLVLQTEERMQAISDAIANTSEQIDAISQSAQEQTLGIDDANAALTRIDDITRTNQDLVQDLAQNTKELDRQANYLLDASRVFHLPDEQLSHPLHRKAMQDAMDMAAAVGATFEQAIAHGHISQDQLFDYSYSPISGTNPIKHSTPWDQLCDAILPPIQETVTQEEEQYVFSITCDLNGYVPTHNDQFCQPLTGNYDKDLVGNRTKRIFEDRVGSIAGRHMESYKLQTYRRDTGELMFDMSAPVYVNGRHWGGIRIGYRLS